MSEKIISELKAELVESAQLGFQECRAADELKRKNAELEREILEFKFSPLSTGSTEWRWPDGRDGRNQTKHRGSTTSSDVGITNLRKQALAAQFDADVDDFLRENEELKDKVTSAERANRELEEKLSTEMLEIATLKSGLSGLSPSASQLKASMQVKQLARDINQDRVKEELVREVEAEKLEVAGLRQALQKAKHEATIEQKQLIRELKEETAAKESDIRKAEQAREKEIRRLHRELEAAKYNRLPSQPSPGPSELPAFGKPERLNSIFLQDDTDPDIQQESLAHQLQAHFAWPAEGQDHEVERLQEELRLMQKFYGESSGTSTQVLEETQSTLKSEVEEVQHLRKMLKDSMRSKRISDRTPTGTSGIKDFESLRELQGALVEKEEEMICLKRAFAKEKNRAQDLEENVVRLKHQAKAPQKQKPVEFPTEDQSDQSHRGSSSPKTKERADDVEMLRALAALRYVEAHWYP